MPSLGPLSNNPLSDLGDSPPIDPDALADTVICYAIQDEFFNNVLETAGHMRVSDADALIINALWGAVASSCNTLANVRFKVASTGAGVVSDLLDSTVLDNLRDAIAVYAGANAKATFKTALTGSGAFVDSIAAAWNMLLADVGSAGGAAVATVSKLVVMADTMKAMGAADSRMTAMIAVAVAAVLEGKFTNGWAVEAIDQAELTEDVRGMLRAMETAAASAVATDAALGSLSLLMLASDTSTATDTADSTLRAVADLSDGAIMYCSLRIGGFDYQGWVLNTDLRAVTEYRNVPFDSFCIFNGRTYAAGEDGIFELSGETDSGEPIDAWFRPFLTNFSTDKMKRVTDLWIGTAATGLYVKVHTKDPTTGLMCEDIYPVEANHGPGTGKVRVQVGRGLKSNWWSYTVHNVAGADFAIDSIAWRRLVLDRRQ